VRVFTVSLVMQIVQALDIYLLPGLTTRRALILQNTVNNLKQKTKNEPHSETGSWESLIWLRINSLFLFKLEILQLHSESCLFCELNWLCFLPFMEFEISSACYKDSFIGFCPELHERIYTLLRRIFEVHFNIVQSPSFGLCFGCFD
jgi:hypothetical protein